MPGGWQDSDRKSRLPDNWLELRAATLSRCGGRCEWKLPSGARCPRQATDVDHKRRGDDHRLANLQGLCADHHKAKTAYEGNAGKRKGSAKRAPERHPGLR